MDDRVSHLLFSANRWECAAQLERDLASGVTIILDRYHYSGTVFSLAKFHPPTSCDESQKKNYLEWCQGCDRGLPEPDVKIFMDLDPAVAAKRGGYGEERFENTVFQNRVRDLFHELIEQDNTAWNVIDASQSQEKVQSAIQNIFTS